MEGLRVLGSDGDATGDGGGGGEMQMFFGRLKAHLCGWMENWKGCVSIQGGELCPNFGIRRITFWIPNRPWRWCYF